MNRRQGTTFRLKSGRSRKTDAMLRRTAGCARFVWNKALELQKQRLDDGLPVMTYPQLCSELATWKQQEDLNFLNEVPSQPLQQKLMDLRRAFDDFFDPGQPNKAFPRFKKRGVNDSFRFPQGIKIEGRRVRLPKIGWVGFFKSRDVEGALKNATVRLRAGRWFISIQTEREVEAPAPRFGSTAGLDLGVARLLTSSEGEVAGPCRAYREAESALAKAGRSLAHKQKGSKNWRKARARLRRLHARVSDVRRDALHKVTTTLSKNHATVVVEDLRVKNMTASARGTCEAPGSHVRAKSGLNKAILDQGWGELVRQLEYKLDWSGGRLIRVFPGYTSQRCSVCGHVSSANRVSQSLFRCVRCGHEAHADDNAALNIRRAGQARMACGSSPVGGRKQEPAGGREACPPQALTG